MICLDIQKKASNGYVPEKESEAILRMDTNLKANISSEYGKLSNWEKSRVVKYLRLLGKNNFDVITYCQIDGVDLNGLEHAFQGEGSDGELGYLHLLVDAITLSKEKNKGLPVSMCLSDDVEVAEVLGHKGSDCVGIDGAIGAWDIELEKGTKEKYGGADDSWEDQKKDDEERKKREEEDRKRREAEAKAEERKKEEEKSDGSNKKSNLHDLIDKSFHTIISSSIKNVLDSYSYLFASGYDLERPYGLVTKNGIIFSDSSKELKYRDGHSDLDFASAISLYEKLKATVGFIESQARGYKDVASELWAYFNNDGKTLVYFPYKILEYAYGRQQGNTGSTHYPYATHKGSAVASSWKKMREKIEEDISITIEDALVYFATHALGCKEDGSNANDVLRNISNIERVKSYSDYISDCLRTCVIFIEYNHRNGEAVNMRLRVGDPRSSCSSISVEDIVKTVNFGNMGSEPVSVPSSIPESCTSVVEFCYEFNHTLKNGAPLFAYKAFEKLQEKGEELSYNSLILGEATDGTILRNGTKGVDLPGHLCHYIIAGSRSGKGVMTLNLLVGALMSNKAIFYMDCKPDIASILNKLAGGAEGGTNGPAMFAINGGDYNAEADKQCQFIAQDSWINRDNIPPEIEDIFGREGWQGSGISSLFYLRAVTLAFGILLARGIEGGHTSDPNFNGDNGMFIVCDEINNLSKTYVQGGGVAGVFLSKILDKIPPMEKVFRNITDSYKTNFEAVSAEDHKKKDVESYMKTRVDFENAFSASEFYALSLMNWFNDNKGFLSVRSKAGFNQKEFGKSDVVVIGQDLEFTPFPDRFFDEIVSSKRYASPQKGIKDKGDYTSVDMSLAFSQMMFGSADALIGYNMGLPSYMAQEDKGSKAYGKLDGKMRGFCYTPTIKLDSEKSKLGAQLSKEKANSSSTVYFKPYLILNEGHGRYVDDMINYTEKAGISKEALISIYPDYNDPSKLNEAVGLPGYLNLLGISDISARLRSGAEVANFVVREYLKYPDDGSGRDLWFQFVTDLRPEWMLSMKDIANLCLGAETNIMKGDKNPILKEYYNYVKFVADHPEYEIDDPTISPEVLMKFESAGDSGFDYDSYGSDRRREYETEGYTVKDDYTAQDDYDSELGREYTTDRMKRAFGDYDVYSEDEEIDDFFGDEDTDYHDGFETADVFDASSNVVGSREGYAYEMAEKDRQIAELLQKLKEAGYSDKDLEGYGVFSSGSSGQGVDCGYRVPEDRYEFGRTDFDGMGEGFASTDDEIRATTMAHLIQKITDRVLVDFGGPERFKSIRVIGGALIVNGTAYRCKVSKDCIGLLPLDIRRKVHAGNIADLFNWSALYRMPNLKGLEFDSINFVSTEVASMLGFGSNISVESFFDAFPSLLGLILGKNRFTRQNYKQEMQDDDLFYYQSRGTAYAGACDSVLSKWTKNSWTFTKNMLTDRNKGVFTRVLGVLFGGAASAVTGVATLGAKGVKGVSKAIDKKRNKGKIGRGFSAVKESFKDIF